MAVLVSSFDELGRVGGTVDFKDTFFDDLKLAVRTASICDGSYLEVVDQIETKEGSPAKVRWNAPRVKGGPHKALTQRCV